MVDFIPGKPETGRQHYGPDEFRLMGKHRHFPLKQASISRLFKIE